MRNLGIVLLCTTLAGCASSSADIAPAYISPVAYQSYTWPAAFFVGGDKQNAAELAQMKGQMVAVEQASIAKKCNIQFQGEPEGS
jgi:hypothetical protein